MIHRVHGRKWQKKEFTFLIFSPKKAAVPSKKINGKRDTKAKDKSGERRKEVKRPAKKTTRITGE